MRGGCAFGVTCRGNGEELHSGRAHLALGRNRKRRLRSARRHYERLAPAANQSSGAAATVASAARAARAPGIARRQVDGTYGAVGTGRGHFSAPGTSFARMSPPACEASSTSARHIARDGARLSAKRAQASAQMGTAANIAKAAGGSGDRNARAARSPHAATAAPMATPRSAPLARRSRLNARIAGSVIWSVIANHYTKMRLILQSARACAFFILARRERILISYMQP